MSSVHWRQPAGEWSFVGAPPAAHVAGAYYPTFKTLEVFHVANHGAVNVVWKDHNGDWPDENPSRSAALDTGCPNTLVTQPGVSRLIPQAAPASGTDMAAAPAAVTNSF